MASEVRAKDEEIDVEPPAASASRPGTLIDYDTIGVNKDPEAAVVEVLGRARRQVLAANRDSKLLDYKGPPDSERVHLATTSTQDLFNTLVIARNSVEISNPEVIKQKVELTQLAQDERGSDNLFLAFGAVSIRDKVSGYATTAPLLLIPVRVTDEDSPCRLSYSGENMFVNPALARILSERFHIELPEIGYDSDLNLATFLRRVGTSLNGGLAEISLDPEFCTVDNFSPGAEFVAADLKPELWPEGRKLEDHPVIRKLFAEGFSGGQSAPDLSGNIDQAVNPAKRFEVLKADSAQLTIIERALRGESFVVEGAAGTGKSTTITNLIANAVALGKKVLVVSEKSAALDVINNWLGRVGLGETCLRLYADHGSPTEVKEDLKRTLALGRPLEVSRAEALTQLELSRGRVNGHAAALAAEVRNSGFSAYQILNESVLLKNRPEHLLDLDCPELHRWSKDDYARALALGTRLEKFYADHGLPVAQPFYGSSLTVHELPKPEKIATQIAEGHDKATVALKAMRTVTQRLGIDHQPTLTEAMVLISDLIFLAHYETDQGRILAGVDLDSADFQDNAQALREVVVAGNQLLVLKRNLQKIVKSDAIAAPNLAKVKNLLEIELEDGEEAKTHKSEIRLANELTENLCLEGKAPESTRARIALIGQLINVRNLAYAIDSAKMKCQKILGPDWVPASSKDAQFWKRFEFMVDYVDVLAQRIRQSPYATQLKRLAKEPAALYELDDADILTQARQNLFDYQKSRNELLKFLKFRPEISRERFEKVPLGAEEQLLSLWRNNPEDLTQLTEYNQLIADSGVQGLGEILPAIEAWPFSGSRLVESIRASWFDGLSADFLASSPLASQFQDATHQGTVADFRDADRRYLTANTTAVAEAHWASLPRLSTCGQLKLLTEELEAESSTGGVSDLMRRTGGLVQQVKPVFLMNPQSVAQFLPRGMVDFDLIVFDEGSQISPAKAIGAIARGKQVVVFGDDKQLQADLGFGSRTDTPITETNIIKLMQAMGAETLNLTWHYRSLREGLMHMANKEFYGGKLMTFPDCERGKNSLGLNFHLVEAAYNTSANPGLSPVEAKEVAQAVLEHAQKWSTKSLAVVTVDEIQAGAIKSEIEKLAISHPELKKFLSLHSSEQFFVRSLEHAQGDERDRVIVSLGFAHDELQALSGKFERFTGADGQKRLNVLMTRARQTLDIFSGLAPEELASKSEKTDSLSILRRYLKFARDGQPEAVTTASSHAPDLLQTLVKCALEQRGYKVETNVGLSQVKLDLAVVDPDDSSRFILGILSDGPLYQGLQSARDRERIIPEALETRGWNLYRLWTLAWLRDPRGEAQKIVKRLEMLRTSPKIDLFTTKSAEVGTSVKRGPQAANFKVAGELFPEYQKVRVKLSAECGADDVRSAMQSVLAFEAPIHQAEFEKRIVVEGGGGGPAVQQLFTETQIDLLKEGRIKTVGEFIHLAPESDIRPRDRSKVDLSLRNISRIPNEEIDAALYTVIRQSGGIGIEELVQVYPEIVGLNPNQSRTSELVRARVEELKDKKVITQANGLLAAAADSLS